MSRRGRCNCRVPRRLPRLIRYVFIFGVWTVVLDADDGASVAPRLSADSTADDDIAEKDVAEENVPERNAEPPIEAAARRHWAFQPLRRPVLPEVEAREWPRSPLDRFVLARLEAVGLQPAAAASASVLRRRLSVDVTGLPPLGLATFDADAPSDSDQEPYAVAVDRLLASPALGERWAQHWLDLARFAETDGFEHDHLRPQAWRYRDWVIDALNEDMPYDRFVRWQLAGDAVQPPSVAARVATGFALCGPDMPDINEAAERRHNVLNELTGTIGAVFLGLQVGCAQCHDHKHEPISQADFYRLRAFFDRTALFGDKALPGDAGKGRVLEEKAGAPARSHVYVRGDHRRPGAAVDPAFPRVLRQVGTGDPGDASPGPRRADLARWIAGRGDAARGRALAARVMVNRIWRHYFGVGIVRTPSDFGLGGAAPSHPQLLEWLAAELVESDWSLKHIHRCILLSATYRQASRLEIAHPEARRAWRRALELDPEGVLLSRQRRKRLEAEPLRDALLAVADTLQRDRGGPGVMVPLPAPVLKTVREDHWKVDPNPARHFRRSIYLFVRRNLRLPFFEAFDRPDAQASCPSRHVSTTAPQALHALNSDLLLAAARAFAGFLFAAEPDDARRRLDLCFRRALARSPTDTERHAAGRLLREEAALFEAGATAELPLPEPTPSHVAPETAAAWSLLALVVFNLNEFVYVD